MNSLLRLKGRHQKTFLQESTHELKVNVITESYWISESRENSALFGIKSGSYTYYWYALGPGKSFILGANAGCKGEESSSLVPLA